MRLRKDMIEAIVLEINLTPSPLSNENTLEKIETLYFGGGTPSLLHKEELTLIFDALQNKFHFVHDAEITLEANPDDITEDNLANWKTLGINRLSVGLQSFGNDELVWMNRTHTAEESLLCIDKIKQAGFNNFSIDLIYGSPLLSDEDWSKTLKLIYTKNIPHISCYALTVEPKTALAKLITVEKKYTLSDGKQAKQFEYLQNFALKNGYEHYEISNFAKPGFRSKHNSSYWQGKKYYGFGPSAHSFDGNNLRKWNVANNALYISSLKNNNVISEEEVLTETQKINEYLMISLRTIEGINIELFQQKFGTKKLVELNKKVEKFLLTNQLLVKPDKIILSEQGQFFADGIAADLFF